MSPADCSVVRSRTGENAKPSYPSISGVVPDFAQTVGQLLVAGPTPLTGPMQDMSVRATGLVSSKHCCRSGRQPLVSEPGW